jgi:hypothetical protein
MIYWDDKAENFQKQHLLGKPYGVPTARFIEWNDYFYPYAVPDGTI